MRYGTVVAMSVRREMMGTKDERNRSFGHTTVTPFGLYTAYNEMSEEQRKGRNDEPHYDSLESLTDPEFSHHA